MDTTFSFLLSPQGSKRLNIGVYVDPAIPRNVKSDPAKLRQVTISCICTPLLAFALSSVHLHSPPCICPFLLAPFAALLAFARSPFFAFPIFLMFSHLFVHVVLFFCPFFIPSIHMYFCVHVLLIKRRSIDIRWWSTSSATASSSPKSKCRRLMLCTKRFALTSLPSAVCSLYTALLMRRSSVFGNAAPPPFSTKLENPEI